MPSGDIMPFKSPLGGTYEVRWAGMTASSKWLRGQPVGLDGAGRLTSPADAVTQVLINNFGDGDATDTSATGLGISCQSVGVDDGDGTRSLTARTGFPLPINPETGAAYGTNAAVAWWPAGQGTLFITKNFHDAATTAAVVPVISDIGQQYTLSASVTVAAGLGFGVEQTNATIGTDIIAKVVDVLDSQKSPIRKSGNAGVYVVFEIELTQGAVA